MVYVKWPLAGRPVYGWAAVALGLIGLASGDFASVWQPVSAGLPHRAEIAYLAAAGFLLGGLAVQWLRTAWAGALALTVLHSLAALLWVPRVVGYPRIFSTWAGFAQDFAMASAGIVLYAETARCAAATRGQTARPGRLLRIGQLLFGLCVVAFGVEHFYAFKETASFVPQWIPPGQRFWAAATGIAFLLAAGTILSGIRGLLGSRLLTGMILLFGALIWVPALAAGPRTHMVWAGNAINLAIAGAAWVVADSFVVPRGRVGAGQ